MPSAFCKRSHLLLPLFAITLLFALPLAAQRHHDMVAKPETGPSTPIHGNPAIKAGPSALGSWAPSVNLGVPAIHAALLHTGKVLAFWYPLGAATNSPARLYTPGTGAIKDVTIPFAGDFFCSGQTILADGRVFVTGGLADNPHPGGGDYGIPLTAFFDPVTETWSQGPPMSFARWYPTNIEMRDGKILTLSGKDETGMHMQLQMEVFDPVASTWTTLPSTANIAQGTDSYPKMKLMPNGKFFLAGATTQTKYFNSVTNRWANVATLNFGNRYHGASVLLPGTPTKPLTQVFTAAGTLDYPGGGATATAEVIDLSVPNPVWTYVNPMNIPRYNANLVILADGTLFEVGGAQVKKYTNPVMTPEIYDPKTGVWTEMADQPAPRTYHSTALLLPDGTVFVGGSDDPANTNIDRFYEIFSPPYLFNGARPVISLAPPTLTYNQQFTINTPDAASISSVALVRPSAVTHDNDMDQRYIPLKITQVAGARLKVMAPLNANYAPPGWYMVVIVNTSGVPSVMPFLHVQ